MSGLAEATAVLTLISFAKEASHAARLIYRTITNFAEVPEAAAKLAAELISWQALLEEIRVLEGRAIQSRYAETQAITSNLLCLHAFQPTIRDIQHQLIVGTSQSNNWFVQGKKRLKLSLPRDIFATFRSTLQQNRSELNVHLSVLQT